MTTAPRSRVKDIIDHAAAITAGMTAKERKDFTAAFKAIKVSRTKPVMVSRDELLETIAGIPAIFPAPWSKASMGRGRPAKGSIKQRVEREADRRRRDDLLLARHNTAAAVAATWGGVVGWWDAFHASVRRPISREY